MSADLERQLTAYGDIFASQLDTVTVEDIMDTRIGDGQVRALEPSDEQHRRRNRGVWLAAAVFAAVVAAGIAIAVAVGGVGEVANIVDIDGTSSCAEAEWLGNNEYLHPCVVDMSDDRLSGEAVWRWTVDLESGTQGTYAGSVTITNQDGIWTGPIHRRINRITGDLRRRGHRGRLLPGTHVHVAADLQHRHPNRHADRDH